MKPKATKRRKRARSAKKTTPWDMAGKSLTRAAKPGSRRKDTGKRTTLRNASGTHYIRRRTDGTIQKEVQRGRSLAQDRKRAAKRTANRGQGDRGDLA